MHHTPTTTLATASEPLTPEAEPARPWEEHVAELDAAFAHLERVEAALDEETLGRPLTADEAATVRGARDRYFELSERRPTLAEVERAYRLANDASQAADVIHTAAEEATVGLKAPDIAYPDVLTVVSPGFTMTRGAFSAEVPDAGYTYTDRSSIETSDMPEERKTAMLAALAQHDELVAAAREADGSAALISAEREADAVWQATLVTLRARYQDLLDYRPSSAAELALITRIVGRSDDRFGMEDEVVEALAAHAERLCQPTQPPGGGMAFPYALGIHPPSVLLALDREFAALEPLEAAANERVNACARASKEETDRTRPESFADEDEAFAFYKDSSRRHGWDAAAAIHNPLIDRMSDIVTEMRRIPATTFEELRPMVRAALAFADFDEDNIEAMTLIANVARLFGMDEGAERFSFDAFAWTERFNAAGGSIYQEKGGDLGFMIPAPNCGDFETCRRMRDDLKDWQAYRIKSYVTYERPLLADDGSNPPPAGPVVCDTVSGYGVVTLNAEGERRLSQVAA